MVSVNRKGAIEMSLNLIIMLIIGMVVLGLVIGFVNSLVTKGTESFDKQLGDNERLKLDEVARCPENLCIIPDPSVSVKKGGKQNVFIKVRAFGEEFTCIAGNLDCTNYVEYEVIDEDGGSVSTSIDDAYILLTGPGFNVGIGEEDAKMYTLKALNAAPVGTYYLTLKLYPRTDDEVSKTLTIDVS